MSCTVSIVSFNNIAHTRRCLASVFACGGSPQIILTNNASTDGTRELFDQYAHRYPRQVRVVHNETNEGFIAPNLRALEMCETSLFTLLNNDCTVEDGWLDKLRRPLESSSLAALSGPECCASRLRDDLSGYRCPAEEMEYLEGSCLMTKTELMRKHGLFSPDLAFAYGEDSDLGLRMRSLGYTLHAVPGLKIIHEGGATSAMVPNINQYEVANHAVMIKRWGPYLAARQFRPSIVVRRQGAMGDALLITPIIDALADRFPDSPLFVETQAVDLFIHNPKVQQVSRHPFAGNHLMVNLDMAYENEPGAHILEGYRQSAQQQTRTELAFARKTTLIWQADPFGDQFTTGDWVGIHCEPTTWPGKNWPADRWKQVIDGLRADGRKVALVGSSKNPPKIPCDLDLREMTSPLDLAASLSHCSLFIGHDSFPMHVAQSQGVPVIGLFGATRAALILTDGSPSVGIDGQSQCAGARHREKGLTYVECAGDCMRSITVQQVQDAIAKITEIPAL